MAEFNIPAEEVQEGDFLLGLDHGYVFEIEEDHDLRGDYNCSFGKGLILITYHTAQGDENYALLSPESLVRVGRE